MFWEHNTNDRQKPYKYILCSGLTERLGLPAAAVPKTARRAMAENFMVKDLGARTSKACGIL
jgi:hypothetical protein